VKLVIFCDGGYKKATGWPGIATYGWLAHRESRTVCRESGVVCWGRGAGSLVAEYGAILAALRWVIRAAMEPAEVEILSDCETLVRRLNHRSFRPGRGLVMLHRAACQTAENLRRSGHTVTFRHVPRREVSAAHSLCRRVYRQKLNEELPDDLSRVRRRLGAFLGQPLVRRHSKGPGSPPARVAYE
jgi:ribonuclease HI